jgi:hypothetical protein
MIDLTYLKKRAEMTRDFNDEKVRGALSKIIPPAIEIDCGDVGENGYECLVHNKSFRNWIDLIPESDRSFIRFEYVGGDDSCVEKYIKAAMIKSSWKNFCSFVSKDASDSDLFLTRHLIWHGLVLGQPVGIDFSNYEMNAIFNELPIDISKNKVKIDAPSFADFYRWIRFAEWGLRNAG